MKDSASRLRIHLLSYGPSRPAEIINSLGFSQPTLSRAVKALGRSVVVTGARRGTQYALFRKVDRLPPSIPLFLVSESGRTELVAEMQPIEPRGWAVKSFVPEFESRFYPDLPYWLDDLRPAGFLGRLVPRMFPEASFPSDIRQWEGDDVVYFLAGVGWDGIGNLLVGERAVERYSSGFSPNPVQERAVAAEYERLSREILSYGAFGSSAGGEQPKFLATLEPSHTPVLVKFSPEGLSPLAIRRRDLLRCEHLALEAARRAGWDATESRLVESSDRLFLQLTRFDRVGTAGRKGVLSLSALDNEFLRRGGSWRDIARGLLQERRINDAIYDEILLRFYFGILIANTDMHSGNLSFFTNGESVLGLAPIYDMSPMSIAPAHEEVVRLEFRKPLLISSEERIWRQALPVAADFWNKVETSNTLSDEVRAYGGAWTTYLANL